MAARCLLLLLLHASAWASRDGPAAPPVVLGPGSLDLRLLTVTAADAASGIALLAFRKRAGHLAGADVRGGGQILTSPPAPSRCGHRWLPARRARGSWRRLRPGTHIGWRGDAESALSSVLAVASQLKRIVCLSKMGVTRATAGPLGLGKRATPNPNPHCPLFTPRHNRVSWPSANPNLTLALALADPSRA